jgi:hypothetical protein
MGIAALAERVALRQRVPLGRGAEEWLGVRGGKTVGLLRAPLVRQPGRIGSCDEDVLCADHQLKRT